MFCSTCGNQLLNGLCPACAPAAGAFTPIRPVSAELKWGVFVATLFIPLIGIVMGGIYAADHFAPKKAVGHLWLFTGIGVVLLYIASLSR